MTTIVSFNVNGVRAVNKKDKAGAACGGAALPVLTALAHEHNVDILCLQEIKASAAAVADLEMYRSAFPHIYARIPLEKKGYSGVAILSRQKPLLVTEPNIGVASADIEGRILAAEFERFIVITCYTPNSKNGLARLEERLEWDAAFSEYIQNLRRARGKPVIITGDLNCAHTDIDIHNAKRQEKARPAGFTREERDSFTCLLHETGLIDTYRVMNPTEIKYSWWSTIMKGREKGVGWRIDYILVPAELRDKILCADILNDFYGSDHCPVLLRFAAD
jgi:exodeoxyribonuclease-3